MKAIAVDDEIYMLETLQEAVSASSDIEIVEAFSSCFAALTYATENQVDVAFLDINMRGIGFSAPRFRIPDETHYTGSCTKGN